MTLANPVTTISRIECKRCHAPLGMESRESGFHFCHKCRTCTVCGSALSASETVSALTELESIHIRCMARPPSSINGEITTEHMEYLNTFRLMICPDPGLNEKSNEEIASQTFNQWVQNSVPTADVLVLFLKKLESVMAECHRVMAQTGTRARVVVSQRDQEKIQAAQSERLNPTTPKTIVKTASKKLSRAHRTQELLGMLGGGSLVTVDESEDFMKQIAAAAKKKLEG